MGGPEQLLERCRERNHGSSGVLSGAMGGPEQLLERCRELLAEVVFGEGDGGDLLIPVGRWRWREIEGD